MEEQSVHQVQGEISPTSGKAITALVLGILSIIIPYIGLIIGIVGIIFAVLALKEIRRTGKAGRGMAIAGLVTSIIGTALYALIIGFLIVGIAVFMENDSYMYIINML